MNTIPSIGDSAPGHYRPEANPCLSFVVPCYNEAENVADVIQNIAQETSRLNRSYEIILVDDGCSDKTVEIARGMMPKYPIRILCLSRNFGKEQAISAGLNVARGDAVTILDADLQEPISHLGSLLEYWQAGYQMISVVRANRDDEHWLKRISARLFYGLFNRVTSVELSPGTRDFRLMDRKVVDELNTLPERDRFMKGLFSWVGFKTMETIVEIEPRRCGKSKFSTKQLFKLALSGLTSFSALPLRIWGLIGFVLSFLSIGYGVWILIDTLIWSATPPGWSTPGRRHILFERRSVNFYRCTGRVYRTYLCRSKRAAGLHCVQAYRLSF